MVSALPLSLNNLDTTFHVGYALMMPGVLGTASFRRNRTLKIWLGGLRRETCSSLMSPVMVSLLTLCVNADSLCLVGQC